MRIRIVTTVLVLTFATSVLAHKGASGVVKERMEAMGSIAANMKSVSHMLRGSADYDASVVKSAMEEISAHAAMLPHKFPKGTDAAPSEAALAIWTDPTQFNALFTELEMSADAVAALSGDKEAVAQGFGKVAKTCKACHATYRIDRD